MKFLLAPALLLAAMASLPALHAETILVLPFFNNTDDDNLDWIGESIAENIRDALAGEGSITVDREDRHEAYRRLSIRPYARMTKASVIKMAEVLDSTQVIYGAFALEPSTRPDSRGTLRITAQILDLAKIRGGPEFLAVGALEDLAALQTHLAWQSLQFLLPETSPGEDEFRRRRPPVRVDAMEYYIRGLLATADEQRLHFLAQAARLDSSFSAPAFELGRFYWGRKNYKSAAQWLEKVSVNHSHYRHAVFLGGASQFYLGDNASAERSFALVASEVPLNEVQNNLGAAQSRRDKAAALESFAKAHEGDPNDPVYLFNLGYMNWKLGRFDVATKWFRDLLQREPEDQMATELLGRCLQRSGPKPGEVKLQHLERLKHQFEESAYLQLRSILQRGKKQ
jgi:tetratricopeptide (TPR) repeat protein